MAGKVKKYQHTVKPYQLPRGNGVAKRQPKASRIKTLSYRLQGLAYALAISAGVSWYFLRYWNEYILLISGILGYFLGWAVGLWLENKKLN